MRLDEATVFRALIGGILLMLVIAIVLWFATARETGTGTARPPNLRLPSVDGLVDGGGREYQQIFARPLFWQGRAPIAPGAGSGDDGSQGSDDTASDLDGVVFLGVIVEENRQRVFLADGNEVHILRNGEIIRGFTVTTIGPESVLLVREGVQVELPKPVDRSEFIDIRPAN